MHCFGKELTNTSSDKYNDTHPRQRRVRCYTCKVNQRGRNGICKNFTNNTCPHGYHDDKEFLDDLSMEQKEQM